MSAKDYGPSGPLISSLPWQYPGTQENIRNLRLNLFLPSPHDISLWTDKFAKQLVSFVDAVDQGSRLKNFRVLIATWHKIRILNDKQEEALGVLERMEVRGLLQVRTRSLDPDGKAVVQKLELERRMRPTGYSHDQAKSPDVTGTRGRYLDWEWEGGTTV